MRKILVTLLSTVAMMGIASLAFAADGAPVKLDSASLGLAIFGCAIGMAVAAIRVARQSRRKMNTTMTASRAPSPSASSEAR